MQHAFALPIPAGNADKARQFTKTILGPRRDEYNNLQKRAGVTSEQYWLQSSPEGDLVIVVSDGDPRQFGEIMADPQTDFDRWIRDQMQSILQVDPADFSETPPAESMGEFRAS